MTDVRILTAGREDAGKRLDVFLKHRLAEITRARIQKLLEAGVVTVSGLVRKPGYRLKAGETVELRLPIEPEPEPGAPGPEEIPLRVIYKDDDVIVIDKPAGLVVHPGAGRSSGTLVNALLYHFPEVAGVGGKDRPGIVHRLDRDTSGVMLAARSERAWRSLTSQFKKRLVEKTYLTLVWGRFSAQEGKIELPLGRHTRYGWKISVRSRHPKPAETYFQVLRVFPETTFLEIRPLTGRTHQIRVHLAASGHPVVGDPLYGRRNAPAISPRLFLHANIVSFIHPATGERLEFGSPLPAELEAVLERQAASGT